MNTLSRSRTPFALASPLAPRRSRRRASTLVETALCMIFVLLPMTGVGLQFAISITAMHAMNQIAREGGRFAAVHAGEATFDLSETQTNPPSLKAHLKQVADNTTIPWNDIKDRITVTPVASRQSGSAIEVTVVYPMNKKLILPIPKWQNYETGFKKVDANNKVVGGEEVITGGFGLAGLNRDYTATAAFVLE